jgi:hypothetical protein
MTKQEKRKALKKALKLRAIKWSKEFYASKWSFFTLIGISSIFTIIQIVSFILGAELNNVKFGQPGAWKAWSAISLSFCSSALFYIAAIYTFRFDNKKAIMFMPIAISFAIANNIFAGAYFMAFTNVIFFINSIFRYFIWKGSENNKANTTREFWIKLAIFFVLCSVVFLLISGFLIKQNLWYFDALASSSSITGAIVMNMKSKYALLIYLFSSLCGIIIFASLGNIIVIVNILVFKILDIFVWMAWSYEEHEW